MIWWYIILSYMNPQILRSSSQNLPYHHFPNRFSLFWLCSLSPASIYRPTPNGKNNPFPFFIFGRNNLYPFISTCPSKSRRNGVCSVIYPWAFGATCSRLFRPIECRPCVPLFNSALAKFIKCVVCPNYSAEVFVHYFLPRISWSSSNARFPISWRISSSIFSPAFSFR